jgi:PAS domain S-box-containing protein
MVETTVPDTHADEADPFCALFTAIGDVYYRTNLEGYLLQVSSSVQRLIGYTREELLGRNVREFEADPALHDANRQQLLAEGVVRDAEGAIRVRDGSILPISISVRLLLDASGQPCAIEGIIRDIRKRKALEQALSASEERFRTIFEFTPIPMAVSGGGCYLDINAAFEHVIGFRREEVIGRSPIELGIICDLDTFAEVGRRAKAGERLLDYEMCFRRKDGVERTGLFAAQMHTWDGQPVFLTAAIDITKRKQAEEELRESEARFRALTEYSTDALVILDLDGRIRYASPAVSRINGYPLDEFLGQSAFEIIHPEDLPEAMRFFQQLCAEPGAINTTQCRLRHADGTWRWIDAVAQNILAEPAVRGIVLNYRDITQKKLTLQALQDSEARFHSVLDHVRDLIYRFDLQRGCYDYISPACLAISGFTVEENEAFGLEGVLELVHPDDRHILQNMIAHLAEKGEGYCEYRQRTKSGEYRWFANQMSLTLDDAGRPLYRDGSIRDITVQQQTALALRDSEQLYRSLFENMLNGFAYCRMLYTDGQPDDFVYLSVNQAFEVQTGLHGVVGKKASEVIPGIREHDRTLLEAYGRVAKTGRNEQFEYFVASLQMWFSISVYNPAPEHFVAVFDVITERKRIEEALKTEHAVNLHFNTQLRALHQLGNILSGAETQLELLRQAVILGREHLGFERLSIWLVDEQESDFVRGTFGIDERGEIRDERASRLQVHPSSTMGQVLADAGTVVEHGVVLLDDHVQVISTGDHAVAPIFDGWRIIGCVSYDTALSDHPITEQQVELLTLFADSVGHLYRRRQVQDALQALNATLEARVTDRTAELTATNLALEESEALFRTLTETCPAGIFVMQDGRFVYVNDAAITMTEYAHDEIVGVTFETLIHPDYRDMMADYARERLSGRPAPERYEMQFVTQTGECRWADFAPRAITFHGRPAIMAIVVDITERKYMEDALLEADRTKDEFLAMLSHELQNPLTAILGWSTEALEIGTPEMLTRAMGVVQRNATRQKQMVDELLDVSRLLHRKMRLYREWINLDEQTRQAVENVTYKAAEQKLHLVYEPPATPLMIHADPARIQQCLANLLGNALKFTPFGGTITVRCTRDGDAAVLTVSDTGRGLPPEKADVIFQIFRQVDRSEESAGLGLGLAITRGLVELHGGRITASSPGRNQGCTFTLTFPLVGDGE